MSIYFSIAIGGALGALSRYWLSEFVNEFGSLGNPGSAQFPAGIFLVNVLGSFLIDVVFVLIVEKSILGQQWQPLLTIGFLGAMTTFSTFSLDTLLLMQQGHYTTAFAYVALSVVICLLAAYGGIMLVRAVF
ncbi:MAG: fluoride efflux transporter CrcB [Pseudohongiellaceae bacterium]